MSSDSSNPDCLLLSFSPHWWRRLRRVADACHTSPSHFVRQVVEAEIIRRELLMEQHGDLEPQELATVAAFTDLLLSDKRMDVQK